MNEQQQELYEKLLKKVNEYCLGQAAEDVIEAIDNLVDNYESRLAEADGYATRYADELKDLKEVYGKVLDENEDYKKKMTAYDYLFGTVKYYIEGKSYTIVDIANSLKVLQIIKENFYIIDVHACLSLDGYLSQHMNPKEYDLLKEVLK